MPDNVEVEIDDLFLIVRIDGVNRYKCEASEAAWLMEVIAGEYWHSVEYRQSVITTIRRALAQHDATALPSAFGWFTATIILVMIPAAVLIYLVISGCQ